MSRPRAWRRYKNYTKAKRKREIDLAVSWYPVFWPGFSDGEYIFPVRGMYNNLHQYSKNKIHCSCPWCSPRTRNKGRHRNKKNYAPSINYSMMDLKKQQSMDADEKEEMGMKYVRFYGGNGYCGCDYEEYYEFDDNVSEESIEEISQELAYEYAESYEYVATGWGQPWETEDDEIEYYDNAHDEAGWVYCTKEEFEENTKE